MSSNHSLKFSETDGLRFQEYCLSLRKLIFTNDLMYFRCRQCVWSEETNDDQRPNVDNLNDETLLARALLPGMIPTHESLCMLIDYFTERKLSH